MGKHSKSRDPQREEPKGNRLTESQKFLKKFLTPAEQDSDAHEGSSETGKPDGTDADSECESINTDQGTLSYLKTLPTKQDFLDLATQIKTTLKEEVGDLKAEITALHSKTADIEHRAESVENTLESLLTVTESQSRAIQLLTRRVEDLDNRGRRCNLRVRGLPESIDQPILKQTVQAIFNDILGQQPANDLQIERIHRALRPRGLPTEKPRDIICCLLSYTKKEDILTKARQLKVVKYGNTEIAILQDLSWFTLQQRKLLKPLTDMLKERQILFRWGYPFSIQATIEGKTHTLTTPEDIHPFLQACKAENLDLIEWVKFVQLPKPTSLQHKEPWMEVTTPKSKRRKMKLTPEKLPPQDKTKDTG
uniref:L1 transposable element RRM domain-containing protein n=1 Tax=Xenopus tropicalis TaxID=8364 RepID=A0A803KDQ1_XENTR